MNGKKQSKHKTTRVREEILSSQRNELSDDVIKKYRQVDFGRFGNRGDKVSMLIIGGMSYFMKCRTMPDSATTCHRSSSKGQYCCQGEH